MGDNIGKHIELMFIPSFLHTHPTPLPGVCGSCSNLDYGSSTFLRNVDELPVYTLSYVTTSVRSSDLNVFNLFIDLNLPTVTSKRMQQVFTIRATVN
jgi:hypothetical protein